MGIIGYSAAVIVAFLVAAAITTLAKRQPSFNRSTFYLAILAFLGTYGGSELFGGIGRIESLSEIGPSVDGFYVITGAIGALLLAGTALLSEMRAVRGEPTEASAEGIRDPRLAHFLFNDTRAAALWLGVRLYIGYQWLESGWGKVNDGAWMNGGTALQGYWERAVAVPEEGRPLITYGWYRDFLQYMLDNGWYSWFAKLVAVGELLIGIALILGIVVGIAAFFGALMNFNFMLAGSASTNPVLFGLAVLLILAWKVAGHWGLDRYLLPQVGAPWSPGRVFEGRPGATESSSPA